MYFRVPEGVTAVSVEGIEFMADENGLFSAEGCSGSVFDALVNVCKCVRVNDISTVVGTREDGGTMLAPKPSYPAMAFQVRDGVGSVSVNGTEFAPGPDGKFIVRSCSPDTADKLINQAGCKRISLPNLLPDERAFKTALLAALDAAGVQKDGRTSVAHLRDLAAEKGIDLAAIEAATAMDFAAAA